MLPRSLYELLPYLYLGIGAIGCAIFDSELAIISSVLVILAGLIVLWMRIDYRRTVFEIVKSDLRGVNRSSHDRRQVESTDFPLIDSSGDVVNANRRLGERRSLAVQCV